ncbi:MAG: hypothetical protein CL970_00030 [Euryarchaeota archaeon]|nr:hypothetical protein [Euryarchaeota archaeon]
MMLELIDISAVVIVFLLLMLIAREIVFRWRVRLRVITRDESLLADNRVKVVNITQGPEGSREVNALRMVPLEKEVLDGQVVGDRP